jgi:hypothetical protein
MWKGLGIDQRLGMRHTCAQAQQRAIGWKDALEGALSEADPEVRQPGMVRRAAAGVAARNADGVLKDMRHA